jgi:hypothetical protein
LEVREEMRELVMQEMSEGDIEELLTEGEADGTVDDTEDEAVVALGEAFDVAADEFGKTKLTTSLVEKKVSRKK